MLIRGATRDRAQIPATLVDAPLHKGKQHCSTATRSRSRMIESSTLTLWMMSSEPVRDSTTTMYAVYINQITYRWKMRDVLSRRL
jgi:hypothetical protein